MSVIDRATFCTNETGRLLVKTRKLGAAGGVRASENKVLVRILGVGDKVQLGSLDGGLVCQGVVEVSAWGYA